MDQSYAIIPVVFMLLFGCFGLVALVFWIWALVDCLQGAIGRQRQDHLGAGHFVAKLAGGTYLLVR